MILLPAFYGFCVPLISLLIDTTGCRSNRMPANDDVWPLSFCPPIIPFKVNQLCHVSDQCGHYRVLSQPANHLASCLQECDQSGYHEGQIGPSAASCSHNGPKLSNTGTVYSVAYLLSKSQHLAFSDKLAPIPEILSIGLYFSSFLYLSQSGLS